MKQIYYSIFLSIFLFLCFCQNLQAQFELAPAKLVKAPGDTVNGFINHYDWKTSPQNIEFKTSLDSPVQVYQANQVKSFYLSAKNEWFHAKSIQIEFYLKRVPENAGKVARSVSGTFFLKERLKGNLISLLMLVDDEQNTRFFIQKESVLSELIHYEYTGFKNGKLYSTKVNQYINQLKLLLNDCSSLNISNSLSYSEAALSQLLTKYYACKGEKINHKQGAEKPYYSAIITPGLFKITGMNSYVTTIGVGLKIALPRNFYNRYGLIQIDQYRYNYTESGINYKGNSHHITVLAGTYFGKSKVQPFVHGGFQWPSTMSFTVGAGISYAKKFNFEIRSPSLAGIMATMHYSFGKKN